MDKSKISKIVSAAEAEIATLNAALDSGDNDTARWTLVILSGIIQDLKRLAEEPTPNEIDKQKLPGKFPDPVDGRRDHEPNLHSQAGDGQAWT